MFVIPDSKVVILFTPRTGSHSLHTVLWEHSDRFHPASKKPLSSVVLKPENIHAHIGWWGLRYFYPDIDFGKYRFLAFYRDPISWFVSALRYHTTIHPHGYHENMSPRAFWERDWGGDADINPQIHPPGEKLRRQLKNLSIIPNQNRVELFNFHDFDNEFIRLLREVDINIEKEDIPHINHGEHIEFHRKITQKDRDQIHKYWHEDYEYLDSKGIHFA